MGHVSGSRQLSRHWIYSTKREFMYIYDNVYIYACVPLSKIQKFDLHCTHTHTPKNFAIQMIFGRRQAGKLNELNKIECIDNKLYQFNLIYTIKKQPIWILNRRFVIILPCDIVPNSLVVNFFFFFLCFRYPFLQSDNLFILVKFVVRN